MGGRRERESGRRRRGEEGVEREVVKEAEGGRRGRGMWVRGRWEVGKGGEDGRRWTGSWGRGRW